MKRITILSAALLLLGGCGHAGDLAKSYDDNVGYNSPASSHIDDEVTTAMLNEGRVPTLGPLAQLETKSTPNGQQPETPDAVERAAPVKRKIIYNATISLVVPKLESTRKDIKKLVSDAGGHIQQFTEQKNYGDRLSGRWVVRVPATEFDDFLAAVEDLGVPESQHIETSEVTAEFYDLDARLKTLRQVEQDMLKIMDKHAEEVADLLEAQRQLGQVRVDIERIEGRLRQLTDLVAMSTVTIEAREDENYTPPQAPAFGDRVATAFHSSIESLQTAGEALVVVAVVLAPWLLAAIVLFLLPLMVVVTILRRRAARPA